MGFSNTKSIWRARKWGGGGRFWYFWSKISLFTILARPSHFLGVIFGHFYHFSPTSSILGVIFCHFSLILALIVYFEGSKMSLFPILAPLRRFWGSEGITWALILAYMVDFCSNFVYLRGRKCHFSLILAFVVYFGASSSICALYFPHLRDFSIKMPDFCPIIVYCLLAPRYVLHYLPHLRDFSIISITFEFIFLNYFCCS